MYRLARWRVASKASRRRQGVYRCRGHYYGHNCTGYSVGQRLIEGAVLDAISSTFADPDLRAEVRAETAKEIKRRAASASKAPGDTQKRLRKLREKLHQAEQRLFEVPSDLMDGAVEVVRGYKAELRAAEADHEAAQGMRSPKDIQAEQEEILRSWQICGKAYRACLDRRQIAS